MASIILLADLLSEGVIILSGSNLLNVNENATIERRSFDEREEIIPFIDLFKEFNFPAIISPLLSRTTTTSTEGRQILPENGRAFTMSITA